MIKATILDFDGILADTLKLNFEVEKETWRRLGIELSEKQFIDVWVSPEPGKEGTKYFVKLLGLKVDPMEILQGKRKRQLQAYREGAEMMPGAKKLIGTLKERGMRLAVVSSNYKNNVVAALEKFGITESFEFVLASGDYEKSKPDPEPYLAAVKRLDLKPGEVLVVEDSDTGVQSAKAASCKVIAVPNRFTEGEDFSRADLVLRSLEEITWELVQGL